MKVSQGIHCWLEYHKLQSKKHSNNLPVHPVHVSDEFGERDLNSLTPDEILSFS